MSQIETNPQMTADDRQSLARRLHAARHADRHSSVVEGHGYQLDRNLSDYYNELGKHNIDGLIDYLLKVKKDPVLLDLGAGRGSAARDLSQLDKLKDARIIGTSLTWSKELEDNLGKENIHITSAELLRGVGNVDGILAVHSLYYADPQLFISRADQVLNEGGIVMTRFDKPDELEEPDETTTRFLKRLYPHGFPMERYISKHHEFEVGFQDLGYYTDVFIGSESVQFAAVKPGGSVDFSQDGFFYRLPDKWKLENIRPVSLDD